MGVSYNRKIAEMMEQERQREEEEILDAAYKDYISEQAANDMDYVMHAKQLQIDEARRENERKKIAALENELYELFCACA